MELVNSEADMWKQDEPLLMELVNYEADMKTEINRNQNAQS